MRTPDASPPGGSAIDPVSALLSHEGGPVEAGPWREDPSLFDPLRRHHEGWLPLAAGLAWLSAAASASWLPALLALVPALPLAAAGTGMLLWPGDRRIPHAAALGGLVGLLLALPWLLTGAFGLLLGLLSGAAAVAGGYHAWRGEPQPEGVPPLEPSLRLSAEVALDQAMLGSMLFTQSYPSTAGHRRIGEELDRALEQFAAAGWLEKPAAYHLPPPRLEAPRLRSRHRRGIDFEHLSFASLYEPRPDEPGRARWVSYGPNATAHAWVVRGDPDRPWLLCVHGYRMGQSSVDLTAFNPRWLHAELGLNLVMPMLPLHGLRTVGVRSGDGFLAGDLLDTIHAEAQAVWDLRRLLSWVRGQSEAPVGVYGLSLGGYTTALLASLDAELACAVAGIPATDFARLYFRHGGPLQERAAAQAGLTLERARQVLRVISPLDLEPLLPRSRRAIFAGVADQLVPADQVRDLWRHWSEPRIEWFPGCHLSFPLHPGVRRLVRETLEKASLVDPAAPGPGGSRRGAPA